MDHNYNDTPLLTNSDYESIMEDLKPDTFADLGSPFRLDQNINYEDPMMKPLMQNNQITLPQPPPLQKYEPVAVQVRRESVLDLMTTPPELSPSLSPDGTIPSRDEYPGQLEFEIQLDSTNVNRKSWLYSHLLNKVFIDMNKALLIQFRVNNFINGLLVRALPVFEQDDFVSVPVQRCFIHAISDDPHFKAHPASEPGVCYCSRHKLVRHVVLCNSPQARYDYNSESDRHSVLVPLQAPHPGSDTTTVEYNFVCKTSCPQGMNRKPIIVIFTLENEQREVLGRLVLPVKICSCPKRDKEKEEKEREERNKEEQDTQNGINTPRQRKRRLSAHEKQEAKRIKTENTVQNESIQVSNEVQESSTIDTRLIERLNNIDQRMNQLESKVEKIEQKLEEILSVMYKIVKPEYV